MPPLSLGFRRLRTAPGTAISMGMLNVKQLPLPGSER